MLDATYKTMKYELALFFLCVRTNNVGYSVVAEFIVQEESAEKIAEALGIIKQWNPSWNPSFFMTDYSEAELLAIEQVFPSAKSFICDFHQEQAWEQWVQDRKHGLTMQRARRGTASTAPGLCIIMKSLLTHILVIQLITPSSKE